MAGNEDTNYVPKSPDFSSFFAQPPPPPPSLPPLDSYAQQAALQTTHQSSPGNYYYSPTTSAAYSYTHAPAPEQQQAQAPQQAHHNLHPHSPQFQPHPTSTSTSTFSPPAKNPPAPGISRDGDGSHYSGNTPQHHHPPQHHQYHQQPHYQYHHSQPRSQPPHQPQQSYPPQNAYTAPHQPGHSQPPFPQVQAYANPAHSPYPPSSHPYPTGPGGTAAAPTSPQQTDQSERMPPRRASQRAPPPPPIEPSIVKTKFPTARIKRIMQADEEVGKVAQQTPIAVGKALELFMISMVSKSAELAKEKGQKRVTANMLKQVVETDEQFDFLRDIVAKVESSEDKAKNSRVKGESESDDEAPAPKRRGPRGGGRKKKET